MWGGEAGAAARLDFSAYRFASITLAIMCVSHGGSCWLIVWYRFVETSLGIAASLLITVLWPERD